MNVSGHSEIYIGLHRKGPLVTVFFIHGHLIATACSDPINKYISIILLFHIPVYAVIIILRFVLCFVSLNNFPSMTELSILNELTNNVISGDQFYEKQKQS